LASFPLPVTFPVGAADDYVVSNLSLLDVALRRHHSNWADCRNQDPHVVQLIESGNELGRPAPASGDSAYERTE
jgi:hypothetical protein